MVDAPGEPLGVRAARFATYFAFAAVLVVLSFIDLDTKRLPDIITLPAIAVFFLAGFAVHDVAWSERAIGAAAGYLLVRIVADGYYYATGREGLGLGDGKLLAIMGALFGWKAIPAIVLLASLSGILMSVPVLVLRRRREAAAGPAVPPPPSPTSPRVQFARRRSLWSIPGGQRPGLPVSGKAGVGSADAHADWRVAPEAELLRTQRRVRHGLGSLRLRWRVNTFLPKKKGRPQSK